MKKIFFGSCPEKLMLPSSIYAIRRPLVSSCAHAEKMMEIEVGELSSRLIDYIPT